MITPEMMETGMIIVMGVISAFMLALAAFTILIMIWSNKL